MKSILITGGAGFIGSNLADYFLKKNFKVTIIDNFITGSLENIKHYKQNVNFQLIEKDVCDNNLYKDLGNDEFDVIYHLASPASPKQYLKYPVETLLANSVGTLNLLNFLKEGKCDKFIFASTSEVYGDPLTHPQNENYWGNVNPVGERSCYDESKRFGEALCMTYFRKFGLDISIVRLFNTYGPNMEKDDGRVVSNFITQALENENMTVYYDGLQTRSFCFVSDLVEALDLVSIKHVKGKVINLGSPDERKVVDLAQLIKTLTASKSEIVFIDKPEGVPGDDPKKRKPDLDKALKLLGWTPKVGLESGLKNTIEYFKYRFSL